MVYKCVKREREKERERERERERESERERQRENGITCIQVRTLKVFKAN